jgi:hypothetical protein
VILLHDVEHHFLGEPAMVLGKLSVHGYELSSVMGIAPWPHARMYSKLLIPRHLASRAGPLLTCAVQAGNASTARPTSRGDRVLRRARARWVSLIMAGLLTRKRTVRSAYWGHVRIQSSHL